MNDGTTPGRTRTILFGGVALVAALAACGSDSESGDSGADVAPSGSAAVVPADTLATSDSDTVTIADDTALMALTAEEICERLPFDSVGAALGLDVGLGEPSAMDTPQCSYTYGSEDTTANVTVASMRPEDVGGRSAREAYGYVVEINRSIAGVTDVEEVELDAGNGAVRISGPALHLGVVQVGDRVLTVVVPAGDASGPEVDSLIAKMSTSLG
jgi:hypothetical protein